MDLLPSRISNKLERVNVKTVREILTLSTWELKKLTNLNDEDVLFIKNVAVKNICPVVKKGYKLAPGNAYASTGCKTIDKILKGGFRKGTITEISGESGSGKTQLALQTAICNWSTGCAYICTEDVFPVKRFEQLKCNLTNFDSEIDYGQNIFIEHITESHELLTCINIRLKKLLEQNKLSVVFIDSIAAPFRCENTNYVERAGEMKEIAVTLLRLAQKYNVAVVCINQVTVAINTSDVCLPALGLAWANMISCRLFLQKTTKVLENKTHNPNDEYANSNSSTFVRVLGVLFAPDLPNSKVELCILKTGIHVLDM